MWCHQHLHLNKGLTCDKQQRQQSLPTSCKVLPIRQPARHKPTKDVLSNCCQFAPLPRDIPNRIVTACLGCTTLALALLSPGLASADFGYQDGRLLPCPSRANCVSTSSFLSPSQYLPPWSFEPTPQSQAFRELKQELQSRGAQVVAEDESSGYLGVQLPYSYQGQQDTDDLEFLFRDGDKVLFRSQAHKDFPPPPFCWTKGCISGPPNRARLENLRDSLGWNSLETDEDKRWVQILLH